MVSYDVTTVNIACQGGGVATRLTADQLHPGSNPGLGFTSDSSKPRVREEARKHFFEYKEVRSSWRMRKAHQLFKPRTFHPDPGHELWNKIPITGQESCTKP